MRAFSFLTLIFFLCGTANAADTKKTDKKTKTPPKPSIDKKKTTAPAPRKSAPTPPKPTVLPPSPKLEPGPPAPAYKIKLHQLENKVTDLKEKIFKTKARIMLLREEIIKDTISESKAILVHRNELGSAFKIVKALYFLDDNKVYYQDNQNSQIKGRFEFFKGSIVPGNHFLTIELVVRGDSSVFTYLKGYTFRIRSTFAFHALRGRITRVIVMPYEKGGMTTSMLERPSIKFKVEQIRLNTVTVKQFQKTARKK